MDPITAVGTAGIAMYGTKELIVKVLGPTADYLGTETKGLVEKCNVNLTNVFLKAKKKLGERYDASGGVSPRVLRHVYDDGRFAEEEIVVEYYGGLLAGSKTLDAKDDQALPYIAMVQRMSSYQLRLHFAIYYELLRLHKSTKHNLAERAHQPHFGLILPHEMAVKIVGADAVDFEYWKRVSHATNGLHKEELCGPYRYGSLVNKKKAYPTAPDNALYVEPNFLGAELFMWALGIGPTRVS